MRFSNLSTMAFSNLWRRKLRTALTVLAVVIGATLVALVISIGSGLQGFIQNQFGMVVPQNAVFVSSGKNIGAAQVGGNSSAPALIPDTQTAAVEPFTPADVTNLAAIPGVVQAYPYRINVPAASVQAQNGSAKYTVSLVALPGYEAGLRPLLVGAAFTDSDTGVCILPYDYLADFGWSASAALGQQVSVTVGKQNAYDASTQAFTLTVVGVTEESLSNTSVIIPIADGVNMYRYYTGNAQAYSNAQPGYLLELRLQDASQVNNVADAVRALGFKATTPAQLLSNITRVFNIINTVLTAFGVIALVVAGIGIINTLLMAIYERTREIGVMEAVGATRGNIRMLFTAEGGALGLLGGALGCLIAYLLGQALNFVGARTFLSGFPGFQMSVFSIGLVVGVVALTTGISLLAALYPANRAARLDPVDALRYE